MNFSSNRAFVNQFLVGLLVTIGLGGTVGLGTVWMRHQVSLVAESNAALQKEIVDVERRVANTRALVEEAQSQEVLARQNEAMHLGLVELNPAQVVAVNEDPIQLLVAHANRRMLESERGSESRRIELHFDPAASATAVQPTPKAIAAQAQRTLPTATNGADAPIKVRLALD